MDHIQAQDGLLLSYYGDDFTGSTDVMESLTRAGIPTVLFLKPPSFEQIQQFKGLKAVGVAGITRSLASTEMASQLLPVFRRFEELHTPIVHYKICSTFDSSQEVGSIGRAIKLGQEVFRSPFVPLVVGAPILARYCIFGNLYARSGLDSDVFRLDRHPTMRRHPITPMDESDLRVHLSRQTDKAIGLFDVLDLAASEGGADEERLVSLIKSGSEIILFDTLYDEHLPTIGRLLWNRADQENPLFTAGSSGLEYALTAYWQASGLLPEIETATGGRETNQVVVVSGSCSPVTEGQIDWALERGFGEVPLQTDRLLDPETARSECRLAVEKAVDVLKEGRSAIVHVCRGPADPRIGATMAQLETAGQDKLTIKLKSGKIFGEALGEILGAILRETGMRRAAVTGGDTSSYVARQMGVEALEMIGPLAPGSPLCRVHGSSPYLDGLEVTFKGGQVGRPDFFEALLRGTP